MATAENPITIALDASKLRDGVLNPANVPSSSADGCTAFTHYNGPTDQLAGICAGMAILEPGASPHPPHGHPEEEFMIVAEGTGEIECDGKVTPAGPGAMMYCAGNTLHGITNTGSAPMLVEEALADVIEKHKVLAMHQDQIERYGGSHGIRDQGLLEAALYRAQTGYYADLIEEAAALWESTSQNHPFIATYSFLAINGARITADPEETYRFVAGLYEINQFTFDQLMLWLRKNVKLR